MARLSGLLLLLVVSSVVVGLARADITADRAECASQLMAMATCISFVQGVGKAPTPDCCSGFTQVVDKSMKCLCVLIKDRNDPGLGIKFNITLTLQLPSKCNAPANVSDCPRLMGDPPNSAEAKMFQKFADDLKAAAGEAKGTGSQTQSSTAKASGEKTNSGTANGGGRGRKLRSWLGMMSLWIFCLVLSPALF